MHTDAERKYAAKAARVRRASREDETSLLDYRKIQITGDDCIEYLEIILKNVKKSYLDQIVGRYIRLEKEDIISSYFFDKENDKNITYDEIKSLESYFHVCGTCTLYLKKLQVDIELKDVLIIISSDEKNAELTLNFPEKQFRDLEQNVLKENLHRLVLYLIQFCKCCEIHNWILGYEPAEDNDMKMIEWKESYF